MRLQKKPVSLHMIVVHMVVVHHHMIMMVMHHHMVVVVMIMMDDHDMIRHGGDRREGNGTGQDCRGDNFLQHRISLFFRESRPTPR